MKNEYRKGVVAAITQFMLDWVVATATIGKIIGNGFDLNLLAILRSFHLNLDMKSEHILSLI